MNYTMADLRIAAESAARSGLMPQDVKGIDAAFYIMASGIELGLQPMLSLRTLRLVKGRISIAAETMLALAIARGVSVDWKQADDTAAILTMTRAGHAPYTSTFTADDARKAGLGGDNWNKYRPAMLRARAISAGVRAYCPDVVSGLYTPEEVESFDDAPRTVQIEARQPSPAIENRPEPMQIEARPADAKPERTLDELRTAAVDALAAAGILPLFMQNTHRPASEWTRTDITNAGAALRRFNSRTDTEKALDKRIALTLSRIATAGIAVDDVETQHGPFQAWSHDVLTKITASLPAADEAATDNTATTETA